MLDALGKEAGVCPLCFTEGSFVPRILQSGSRPNLSERMRQIILEESTKCDRKSSGIAQTNVFMIKKVR